MSLEYQLGKSLALSKEDGEPAAIWSAAIASVRAHGGVEDTGPSELILQALGQSRRFERWVFAATALNVSLSVVAVLLWSGPRFPLFSHGYGRLLDAGAWPLLALVVGSLWLVYAWFGYRDMRRSERWIMKSYLVDAWLDRRQRQD